ncbi:hypothetical protein [Gayadomonas joobiniege]|uniref:hypothetical protein n=1 Tax=Gayadomonas joobiniege TaxID=1234606 RepID=UPI00035E05FE|nr:hypothetical protein [Gayadomonas joobiniege]
MKTVLFMLVAFFSTQAMAHPDHHLSDNAHAFYHAAFWIVFAAVVFKGISWWRSRKSRKQD